MSLPRDRPDLERGRRNAPPRDDVVVMDTHAGVEHFGRALARGFDSVVVVVEPTFNSVQVGVASAALANELGIGTVHLVVNRARVGERPRARVGLRRASLGDPLFNSVTAVPYDETVLLSEPSVEGLLEGSVDRGRRREAVDRGRRPRRPDADQGGLIRAVVIGTGPAGITAAETLRRLDPSGSVVALSVEPFAPYSPPAMADHYLTGRERNALLEGPGRGEHGWASTSAVRLRSRGSTPTTVKSCWPMGSVWDTRGWSWRRGVGFMHPWRGPTFRGSWTSSRSGPQTSSWAVCEGARRRAP